MAAAAKGYLEVVELLLNKGADFNHEGTTVHSPSIPVFHRADSGRMVRKLLQSGANLPTPLARSLLDSMPYTPCHTAIEELVHRRVAVNDIAAGGTQRGTIVHAQARLFCHDRENGEFCNETTLRESLHGAVQELLAHPLGGRALSLRQNVRFDTEHEGCMIPQAFWVDRGVFWMPRSMVGSHRSNCFSCVLR
ncbi:hypothetical protein LY76DRAFT_648288 [Colletotrichum caudatum]|nr:hypothetical protein LY76DRAFT_648288 [Colletotrichum caudatum]